MNELKNKTAPTQTQPQIMENQRLIMWCFMVASILSFGSLTSAYIIRIAQGNWYAFEIPSIFTWNCLVVIASSACTIFAYSSAKNDELDRVKYGLIGTFLLGVLFLIFQIQGWYALNAQDIFFSPKRTDNGDLTPLISGSFFFAISAVHFVHIVAGLIFLLIVIVKAFMWKVHKKNMLTISLAGTYWHFVGILWIYLYLFLKYWN